MFLQSRLLIANFSRRQFSSSSSDLLLGKVPHEISEEFSRRVTKYYKFSDEKNYKLKPFTVEEGNNWAEELNDVVLAKDPSFADFFAEARERKPFITSLKGISFPNIPKNKIPKSNQDLSDEHFIKAIRPAEVSIAAFSKALGIENDDYFQNKAVGCIFATESEKNHPGSFQSSTTPLSWHNDGWESGGPIPYVCLLGVSDGENALTKLISSELIIDHFIKNGKETFLEILNQDCYVGEVEDYGSLPIETKVLDRKNNKINFSNYGYKKFSPKLSGSSPKKFEEAIACLMDSLEKITPITIALENGQLALIKNESGLHSRQPNPNNIEDLVGKRLLLRILGTPAKE